MLRKNNKLTKAVKLTLVINLKFLNFELVP